MQKIILGVVGKNIAYSLSPTIHQAFAKAEGLTVMYSIQDVGEGSFEEKIIALQQQGFSGCNITVPFKEAAFGLADRQSPHAKKAGAANTFVFTATGIEADNTDGVGLLRDITHNLAYSLMGKRILICGAGGAVKGILAPLLAEHPASITIANRTVAKAKALANDFSWPDFSIEACPYEALTHQIFDVVIDATPPSLDPWPLPTSLTLGPESLVYDLKYQDLNSPTLRWGRQQDATIVTDGLGMLVEQAAEAFKVWTRKQPETEAILAFIRAKRSPS